MFEVFDFVSAGKRLNTSRILHRELKELIERCWQADPTLRPSFEEILPELKSIRKEVLNKEDHEVIQAAESSNNNNNV